MTAKRKLLLVAIAAAVVLAGGAFAWKSGKGSSNAAAVAPATKPGERPIELIAAELHTIKPRGLVDVVRFTGTTQPIDQTIVKARVAGRLAEVLVREGDRVTKGQVLARFETNELQSRVNERQSALDAARADARWTARDLGDKETLAKRNIVSQSALDAARATAENKASMVSVAEAQLEIAQRNLGDAEVKAPFDGVVGERIANQGESLPIDGKILALLDTSHVEVAAQMPAADVVRLKVGQPVTVTLEGFGDREFQRPASPASVRRRSRARARSRSMSRSATATTRCAAACSPWARSSSPRRATRSPCRPPPCARTSRVTMCWPSRTACWCASRSAPCAPGRAASSSR